MHAAEIIERDVQRDGGKVEALEDFVKRQRKQLKAPKSEAAS